MVDKELRQFLRKLRLPLVAVVLLWLVKMYEYISGVRLVQYGIYPRQLDGLKGIITSPFIHGDWSHLISNSFPILMLTVIMVVFYERVAVSAYLFITLLTGFFVWLFARESYHIGASGVVYGLTFFVMGSGIFRRNARSIVLALLVLAVYSGILEGFVPKEGVSWESHLIGAISGTFFAFLVKNIKEEDEEDDIIAVEPELRNPFLPRDSFQITKHERWLEEQRIEQERQERIIAERLERERIWRERMAEEERKRSDQNFS